MKTLLSITTMLSLSALLHAQNTTGDFNTIIVTGGATITVTQSDSNIVSPDSKDGSSFSAPKIEDGVVHIHSSCNVRVKSLKAIIAKDASTVKSDNILNTDDLKITETDASTVNLILNAKTVEAVTKDASTLKLSGTADNFDVTASDASTVKASELKATAVNARAGDGSRIKTWAESKLNAKATDGAVINYKGTPADKSTSSTDGGSIKTDDGKTVSTDEETDKNTSDKEDSTFDEHIGFKHVFNDGYLGFGYVLGPDQTGATIKYGTSREFNFGLGEGYKFFKWNGIGADIYYKSTDFYLDQNTTKVLPNNVQHNAEKISFNNLGGVVFDRFFIGKIFFDGGFYYDWIFHTRNVTWDNYSTPNTASASSTKTINRDLSFAAPSDYGLQFRIGAKNGVSLYFNYRMANLIKEPSGNATGLPQLPPYVLGINIGGF